MRTETNVDEGMDSAGVVAGLISRARVAMESVSTFDQEQVT
jgi:hypothetical protein